MSLCSYESSYKVLYIYIKSLRSGVFVSFHFIKGENSKEKS